MTALEADIYHQCHFVESVSFHTKWWRIRFLIAGWACVILLMMKCLMSETKWPENSSSVLYFHLERNYVNFRDIMSWILNYHENKMLTFTEQTDAYQNSKCFFFSSFVLSLILLWIIEINYNWHYHVIQDFRFVSVIWTFKSDSIRKLILFKSIEQGTLLHLMLQVINVAWEQNHITSSCLTLIPKGIPKYTNVQVRFLHSKFIRFL